MTSQDITIVFGSAIDSPADSPLNLSEVARLAARRFPTATVLAAPSLYDVTRFGPLIKRLRASDEPLVIVDIASPRATFWRLASAGVTGQLDDTSSANSPSDKRMIHCFDANDYNDAEQLLGAIARIVPQSGDDVSSEPTVIKEIVRTRWYPIVDYDRCIGCLECLNFCLFGVYGLDEDDRLFVEEPDACRAGCPACARVCPQHAILFPRCPDQAIAGRAEFPAPAEGVTEEKSTAEKAANERSAAVEEMAKPKTEDRKKTDTAADPLDRLVDEIDEMDL